MKRRIASLLVLLAFVATPVLAQGPPGQGGGPGQAGGGLASELAALTARVAKLEGNIVASDLAGTYNFVGIVNTMDGIRPGVSPASITTEAFRGTLTLNANGTGTSGPPGGCEGSTLTQGTWILTGVAPCSATLENVTWTYANGVITITFESDGDQIPFAVALGGRFLIMAFAPFHASDPSSNQFLFIATRLQ
jgi:hypothetical protein